MPPPRLQRKLVRSEFCSGTSTYALSPDGMNQFAIAKLTTKPMGSVAIFRMSKLLNKMETPPSLLPHACDHTDITIFSKQIAMLRVADF